MEAEHEFETLFRPEKDIHSKQRPFFPVEHMLLANFAPLRKIAVLLFRRLPAQVRHFQRQLDLLVHPLQRTIAVKMKPRAQDRVLFDADRQRLFQAPAVPRTLHVFAP